MVNINGQSAIFGKIANVQFARLQDIAGFWGVIVSFGYTDRRLNYFEEKSRIYTSRRKSMPSEGVQLFHCYNRGCGQKFDPNENKEGNKKMFSTLLYV